MKSLKIGIFCQRAAGGLAVVLVWCWDNVTGTGTLALPGFGHQRDDRVDVVALR
jgi:hypothetical protein